ncbi:bacterial regulatory helix-turn-helix, lysR family protein, partial [Yersinia pestis PY-29]
MGARPKLCTSVPLR